MQPLDAIPLFLLFPITVVLGLVAAEIGFRLGTWYQKRTHNPKDPSLGALAGASLGLLAFLLAFLTAGAADRFNLRRELVVTDANAIGTAALRSQYLPEPYPATSHALYKQYVDVRVAATQGMPLDQAAKQSEEILDRLWQQAVVLARSDGSSEVTALYIDALNTVIDVHTERLTAALARIPPTLLWGVLFITILAMVLVGFNNSYDGQRSIIAMVVFVLIFSAVILLIVDLDRPLEGTLMVSQKPMLDLQQSLSR